MSFCFSILKLCRIIGEVLKTVVSGSRGLKAASFRPDPSHPAPQYAVNRESLGVDWSDPAIQREIVADFDSAVNSWVNEVPWHLRWDPHQPDRVFFEQSCLLYALVYTVQVGCRMRAVVHPPASFLRSRLLAIFSTAASDPHPPPVPTQTWPSGLATRCRLAGHLRQRLAFRVAPGGRTPPTRPDRQPAHAARDVHRFDCAPDRGVGSEEDGVSG
jgi:hypothetical protein